VRASLRHPVVVALLWVGTALALTVGVTPLETVVARGSGSFLPAAAPSVRALRVMDAAFGSGRAQSYGFVVVEGSHRLGRADQAAYRELVARLRARPNTVVEIQDYLAQPSLRSALTSRDGQATYVALGLSGAVGSPQSVQQIRWVRTQAAAVRFPPGTRVFVTGDPAMIADLSDAVTHTSDRITVISAVLLILILLVIYRRPVTIVIPLATIGVAVVCARGVLALLGEHGLALSTYTTAFVMAIALGAGTDYTVFLISRFREEYAREDGDARAAVAAAGDRIGGALLASAGTVVLGCACLAFTKLAIFSTTGPAMALAIAVTLLVSLTLTPVLMAWAGPRIGPALPTRRNLWARAGVLVAARPGRVLSAGLLVLIALALAVPTLRLSFDERAAQPASTPSNRGYQALNAHFPDNTTLPDYLLVQSEHDLRTPADLAALNTLSVALGKVPGVAAVYSITQPSGTPIPQAKITTQLADLATNLHQASTQLSNHRPDLARLHRGSNQLADGTEQAATGSQQLSTAIATLSNALHQLSSGLGTASGKTGTAADGAAQLHTAAADLATGLQAAHDQAAQAVSGLARIIAALDKDLLCTLDPICNRARAGLHQLYDAQHDLLLPGLQQAADGAARIADGTSQLAHAQRELHDGLVTASAGAARLDHGSSTLAGKVDQLSTSLQQLAAGAAHLPPGISQLIDQTAHLSQGLNKADTYLHTLHTNAATPDAAGFYLPASALSSTTFAGARSAFLSPDGHLARIQIIGTTDPLTSSGLTRFAALQTTARQTIRGTPLADSRILATGAAGLGTDLRHYLLLDGRFVVAAVLTAVFVLLVLTLRSLIAPLYLIASVALSFAAALGLTTLVWQHLLGHAIEFNVPIIGFVLLVAVGADYNILLMTRMREHGRDLTRDTVAHAVTATGPVITAAGIIFASTFLALTFTSIAGIEQTGFAVATGLILDTVIVRTLLVPACAALLGSRSWWPHRPDPTRAAAISGPAGPVPPEEAAHDRPRPRPRAAERA
jgi:RND superfamily putative drug exporter